jgi:FMN reductase (NADPH)
MNPVVELLRNHRSIRKFKPDPVPEEMLEAIVGAAQMASTSSNVQAYSVIAVKDAERKRVLADVAGGQLHVEQCPLLLVWCADLNRIRLACERNGVEMAADTMEQFIVATVDVALAAQNAAVAAESLGLGIVYIGGIRNDLREVTRLLNIPPLVYPVFGMCVGYPDQPSGIRPRLPLKGVLHRETYDPERHPEAIEQYDKIMRDYYRERTGGRRDSTWSEEMAAKFRSPARAYLREYLREQGFRIER